MKIILLLVGKTEFPWVRSGIELYEERLKHYVSYQRIEIQELKATSSLTRQQIKEREGDAIMKYLKPNDELILMDERGEEFTSERFASQIEKKSIHGTKNVVFAIGGAYGFSDDIYKRANEKISLSKMTFSHQMVRVIFLEQLYRAYTIIKGEPYHHK
ncbi:MAG: 23S rRNA (pseudouridine(1915)-N(3))-methyltransferase RlmH [Bacteroidetes bacterium GWF2_40_14]|nr:MAG: 23S rRNA (pseudouridine(1915)-N(3))-methyltransferase RlmH [Bacteroidetes bacterium GWF2_40_14]